MSPEITCKRKSLSCLKGPEESSSFSTHLSADKEIVQGNYGFYKMDICLLTDSR